jgi:hypothetical protein
VERTGCSKLVIVGICSGANVGIGILDRLPECVGLFALSTYPFSDGDSFGRRSHRTTAAAKGYLRKALQWHTWQKLFRGAIDFKSIFSVLFGHHTRNEAQTSATEAKGYSPIENLNLRPMSVSMIYGDADPDTNASLAYYRSFAEDNSLPIEFDVIGGADHNFYSLTHTQELAQKAVAFVQNDR